MRSPSLSRGFLFLLLAVSLPAAGLAALQRGKSPLDRAYQRWFRAFKAGKIDPEDAKGPLKTPYLPRSMVRDFPTRGLYTRLHEARALFGLLVGRGTAEDGERLLAVLEVALARQGKEGQAVGGREWRIRRALLAALQGRRVKAGIQAAILDRVRKGLRTRKTKDGEVKAHDEPGLAAALLPVLASYGTPSLRYVLEECLEVEDPRVRAGACRALGTLGSGVSIAAVARALRGLVHPEDVRPVADALVLLAGARRPPPGERGLQAALSTAQDSLRLLKDWRARLPLVGVLRAIRSASSVPLLLGLLEECANPTPGLRSDPVSGTLRAAVHDALVDLTGFYASPREPGKWRSWWEANRDEFRLAPARETAIGKGKTVARTFFGIPVTGSRVIFVLDVSGSMAWPFAVGTRARPKNGGGPSSGGHESRLQRAKKELLRAVNALGPDARFNVVFFSGGVRSWKKKLVQASSKNKRTLAAYLAKVRPGGGTALYDGLETGLKIKTRRKRGARYPTPVDEVFLLSDGMPSVGTVLDPVEILSRVREWNQGANVRINTIFVGSRKIDRAHLPPGAANPASRMRPEDFMSRLAKENYGVYRRPTR